MAPGRVLGFITEGDCVRVETLWEQSQYGCLRVVLEGVSPVVEVAYLSLPLPNGHQNKQPRPSHLKGKGYIT